MRKLIPGNYNIICKGKSGQLIETSPGLGPTTPRDKIFSVVANSIYGVVSDGSYIYFSTYAGGVRKEAYQRIYKYSIVDATRIWTTRLIYVYHGTNDTFSTSTGGQLFVLGNYVYLHKGGAKYQRYLKSDGSKYGVVIESPTIEWFPPAGYYPGLYGTLSWGSNCFVDGGYIYGYTIYQYQSTWAKKAHSGVYVAKLDSNFNVVSVNSLEPPLGTPITWEHPDSFFILGWDGTRLCGGGRWEYDGGDWGKGAFATWNPSGGPPTNTWICVNPWGQEMTPTSGCSGNNIIIGNEIWSFGEMHDGERVYNPENERYYLTINPEKNAMYYNANWRLTCIHWPYIHSSQPGEYDFYNYGSFHRGCYGETPSCSYNIRQIAKHGDKLYVVSKEVGTHEMTTGGVYRHIRIV